MENSWTKDIHRPYWFSIPLWHLSDQVNKSNVLNSKLECTQHPYHKGKDAIDAEEHADQVSDKINFHGTKFPPHRKTVSPTSRCSESKGVLCCSNNDMMLNTCLNSSGTTCYLLLKLPHLNIIHQVFLMLIAVSVTVFLRVCFGAGFVYFRYVIEWI